MNKLYLLPISLLLLNPAFAEDIESNPLSSQVAVVAAEEPLIEAAPQAEIAHADKPATQPVVIEIDPKVLEDLQAEIAAIIDEKGPVDEDAFIEKEIAILEEPALAQQPVYIDEPANDFDEEEIAFDEQAFAEEEVVEAPRPKARRPMASQSTPSRTMQYSDGQLAEKEPGSHVRRFTTKPSQAPKVQQQVADGEYQKPAPKKLNPPVRKQTAKPLKERKVQEELADSELEQPVAEKQAPKSIPSIQQKANAQQRRTADAQSGQKQQKESVRKQPQAKQTPPAKKPNARVQSPAATQSAPSQGQNKPRQTAPAKKPDVRVQAPQTKQKAPSQTQAQAPSKPKASKRAPMAQQPASVPSSNQPSAKPQSKAMKQQRVAQDEQQGQMNMQGMQNSQGQMNSQGMQNSQGQMNSQPQGQMNSQGQTSAQPKSSMKKNDQNKMNGMVYNTATRPVVKGGTNLWVMGDALLWQAVEENLTYIYSGDDESNQRNRNLHTVDFDWDWGFRLGAGYNTPRDGWDIDMYWTHIRNTSSGSQHATSEKPLFEVWGVAAHLFPGNVDTAKAEWEVHLDQVDLDLGRQFYVGKFLSIRPFVGLRSDWIFQEYEVELKGTSGQAQTPLEQESKLKNRFWGFGFVAGLDTDWKLGWGFSIYGEADMSILMSFFDIDQKGTQDDVKIWSQDKSFRTGRAILDLELGLRWARLFLKDRFGLALKVGYEYHLFFNQNQFVLSSGNDDFELFNPVKGDLTYQGAIGSIQFDF